MKKNYKIIVLFLMLYCHKIISMIPKDITINLDENAIVNILDNPKTTGAVENFINNSLKGMNKSLEKDGKIDEIVKNSGKVISRSTDILIQETAGTGAKVGSHFNEEFSDIINAFDTSKGSDIDNKINEFFQLGMDNTQYFLNAFVYPNLLTFTAISLTTTAAFYAIPIMAQYLERELLNPRPTLIIESSKKSYYQKIISLFWTSQLPLAMVFSPALKQQLDDITKVTTIINKKIKEGKTNIKYRNLMLYGPPGTGKTMFAKELAKRSGLNYAFMSGSSFSKFKDGEGITALDELFAWAKNSDKGLMIFIDEAETFLSKRENMDPQSKAYQLLNNFLNYTGERSSQFMIVFATNHKDALDSAMYRRIDDLIEMPLPSKNQRLAALNLYKNKILLDKKQNTKEFLHSVHATMTDEIMESIAEKTAGLSYGDLEGIINTLKTDVEIVEPSILSEKLIHTVVARAVKKHFTFTNGQHLGKIED